MTDDKTEDGATCTDTDTSTTDDDQIAGVKPTTIDDGMLFMHSLVFGVLDRDQQLLRGMIELMMKSFIKAMKTAGLTLEDTSKGIEVKATPNATRPQVALVVQARVTRNTRSSVPAAFTSQVLNDPGKWHWDTDQARWLIDPAWKPYEA